MGVNFPEYDVRQAARPCKLTNSLGGKCVRRECPWVDVCDLPQRDGRLKSPLGPSKFVRRGRRTNITIIFPPKKINRGGMNLDISSLAR